MLTSLLERWLKNVARKNFVQKENFALHVYTMAKFYVVETIDGSKKLAARDEW